MRLSDLGNQWWGLLDESRGPWWPQAWADDLLNQPKILTWLRSLGLEGELGTPMVGGVGRAYPVGKQAILKLTPNAKEASAAAVIQGHNSAHAPTIYDVKRLGSFKHPVHGNISIYGIVMQRLNTGIGKRYRIAADALYKYLDFHPEAEARQVYQGAKDALTPLARHDTGVLAALRQLVGAVNDIQQQTGVLPQDTHGGNWGFRGREAALFDFGRSRIDWNHPKTDGVTIRGL